VKSLKQVIQGPHLFTKHWHNRKCEDSNKKICPDKIFPPETSLTADKFPSIPCYLDKWSPWSSPSRCASRETLASFVTPT